jgi:aminoglycoside phosphotransferase (APT) family kinase protein
VAAGAPGRSLRDTLAAGGAIPWDLLLRSIASLRAVPPVPDTPVHDFASARKAGSNMLRKASFLDERFAELADRLDALPLPQETSGFVHGDLHDKQIFLHGDAAHLIDLEGVGSGDPNFDLANLAEHLRLRSLQQSGTDDGSADELMRRAGLAPDLQLRWRVLVRARLAGVYALRPRWAQLTERLYSETCNLLSQIP